MLDGVLTKGNQGYWRINNLSDIFYECKKSK